MGHAQKTASRATCRAYSSVILVPLTGPVGNDCDHSGDGGKGCGLSAYASGSAANTVSAAVPANRTRFIVVSFGEVGSGGCGNCIQRAFDMREHQYGADEIEPDERGLPQEPGILARSN